MSSDSLSKGLKFSSHHNSVAYVLGKHSNTQTWASYLFLPACCCTANEIRKATGFQQRRHSNPALLTPLLLMPWFFLLTGLPLEPHSMNPNKKGGTALPAGSWSSGPSTSEDPRPKSLELKKIQKESVSAK